MFGRPCTRTPHHQDALADRAMFRLRSFGLIVALAAQMIWSPARSQTLSFVTAGASGMINLPPHLPPVSLPVVLVLPDHLGPDGRSDVYAERLSELGIAVLELLEFRQADLPGLLAAMAADPRIDMTRVAIMGFGAGARMAMGLSFPFAAHVLLYPGCPSLPEPAGRVSALLLLHGEADTANPVSACRQAARHFEADGARVRHVAYRGASYGWDFPQLGFGGVMMLPEVDGPGRLPARPWPALAAVSAHEAALFLADSLAVIGR